MRSWAFILVFSTTNAFLFSQDIRLYDKVQAKQFTVLSEKNFLIHFYPGAWKEEVFGEDTCEYVTWTCSSCDTISFVSWLDKEEFIQLPQHGPTQTEVLKIVPFTQSKKEYAAVFFQSHNALGCENPGGRSTCGILSVAVLVKKGNNWEAISFNPALGCYGLYGYSVSPTLYSNKSGTDNYWIVEDRTGWNGGIWTFEHFHFLQFADGKFSTGPILKFAEFLSGGNYWDSEMAAVSLENLSTIEIRTSGYLDKQNISEMPDKAELPACISDLWNSDFVAGKFKYTSWYTLSEGRLKLVKFNRDL